MTPHVAPRSVPCRPPGRAPPTGPRPRPGTNTRVRTSVSSSGFRSRRRPSSNTCSSSPTPASASPVTRTSAGHQHEQAADPDLGVDLGVSPARQRGQVEHRLAGAQAVRRVAVAGVHVRSPMPSASPAPRAATVAPSARARTRPTAMSHRARPTQAPDEQAARRRRAARRRGCAGRSGASTPDRRRASSTPVTSAARLSVSAPSGERRRRRRRGRLARPGGARRVVDGGGRHRAVRPVRGAVVRRTRARGVGAVAARSRRSRLTEEGHGADHQQGAEAGAVVDRMPSSTTPATTTSTTPAALSRGHGRAASARRTTRRWSAPGDEQPAEDVEHEAGAAEQRPARRASRATAPGRCRCSGPTAAQTPATTLSSGSRLSSVGGAAAAGGWEGRSVRGLGHGSDDGPRRGAAHIRVRPWSCGPSRVRVRP